MTRLAHMEKAGYFPLPERVEQEMEMLARWDPQAAALQREKMEAPYRQ